MSKHNELTGSSGTKIDWELKIGHGWQIVTIFYMAGWIPCTCGCGKEVTYAMKQNHLNGRGKID